MKKHLFFTGPIGCGKSTAIARGLGDRLCRCGGFLTRRYREPHLHFALERPDGTEKAVFLDFSRGTPEADLDVFSRVSWEGPVLVLDEIGGVELLNPNFAKALGAALQSDIPIIGVVKSAGAADALAKTLGLAEQYQLAAAGLMQYLEQDGNTLLYPCCQFDEHARLLAEQWAEEYVHE